MALCIWLINPESIAMVIVSVFVGGIIYFAALLLVRGLSKAELAFFTTFVKGVLKKPHMIK